MFTIEHEFDATVVTLVDESVSLTSAVLSVAVLFAIATPRIIVVVAAGAVYNVASDALSTFDINAFLNVSDILS